MTEALTRLFARTKKVEDPEYLPPYFWHRYWVWNFLIPMPSYYFGSNLLDMALGNTVWYRDFSLSLLSVFVCSFLGFWVRRRWADRQREHLAWKLSQWVMSDGVSEYEAGEMRAKLSLFAVDLNNYTQERKFSPLSIRLTPWPGSGTRYTVYQKRRRKRVFTFFHE